MARKTTSTRARAAVFLILSLFAAGVASLVIYSVIQNYQQELDNAQVPHETIQVVVASHALFPGANIQRQDLAVIEIPPAYVPPGAYRSLEPLMGRVPQERILANEFIREERLADAEAGYGLNALVPRGMRAVSVAMGEDKVVSGFVEPGNYVDLLVTVTGDKGLETLPLMEAITLLAIENRLQGGTTDNEAGSGPSITLAVSPEDAEKLQYASSNGKLTLTLRNDVDVTSRVTHGEEVAELIGRSDVERIPVKQWKEKKPAMQTPGALVIIRGTSESTMYR